MTALCNCLSIFCASDLPSFLDIWIYCFHQICNFFLAIPSISFLFPIPFFYPSGITSALIRLPNVVHSSLILFSFFPLILPASQEFILDHFYHAYNFSNLFSMMSNLPLIPFGVFFISDTVVSNFSSIWVFFFFFFLHLPYLFFINM